MTKHSMQDPPHYVSYLLRLWKPTGDEHAAWRASLESSLDRQQINFASLKALLEFLMARFGQVEGEQSKSSTEQDNV